MYICNKCGETFETPNADTFSVPYGNGTVTANGGTSCPCCNSEDFTESMPCRICGRHFAIDNLHRFICEECLEEEFDKVEDLLAFAETATIEGDINDFALKVFGGTTGVNDLIKIVLIGVQSCNPQMLKEKKHKYIQDNLEDLAEWWESKNEQTEIL